MKVLAKLRLCNSWMVEARKKKRWSQGRLAKAVGMKSPLAVMDVEHFDYRHCSDDRAVEIAAALGIQVDQVMPEEYKGQCFKSLHVATKEIDNLADIDTRIGLNGPDMETEISRREFLNGALDILNPRERQILSWYNDLEQGPNTLREMGTALNICGPRVGQIRNKALRKMRTYAVKHRVKALDLY